MIVSDWKADKSTLVVSNVKLESEKITIGVKEWDQESSKKQWVAIQVKVFDVSRTKLRKLGIDFAGPNGVKQEITVIAD